MGIWCLYRKPAAVRQTIAALVPAFNEEVGLADTLASLLNQSRTLDRIVVVDDCSTDRTSEIAKSFPNVEVVKTSANSGSKAMAQNFGLQFINEDLVVTVDADTVLDPHFVWWGEYAMSDQKADIAAGYVMTRGTRTVWERGRAIEYLFGFSFGKPAQAASGSVMVCSGCCSIIRVAPLKAVGGFSPGTIAEDMTYTWQVQMNGRRALFAPRAVAYVSDPDVFCFMKKQVKRWMHGYFQNVRLYLPTLWRRKPMMATWATIMLVEVILAPLWVAGGILVITRYGARGAGGWLLFDLGLVLPWVLWQARKEFGVWRALRWFPCLLPVRLLNLTYAFHAVVTELIMRRPFAVYEKGH